MKTLIKTKWKLILVCTVCSLGLIGVIICTLLYNGIIHINGIGAGKYPVRGVDVSAYQGDIDWDILSSQNIQFAFIKATEGSDFVDEHFKENWEKARTTELKVGAYHFFSFESPGKTQAENFIKVVGTSDRMLPPVIDVEYYGRFKSQYDIETSEVAKELRAMVDGLEAAYGVKPIIYVSEESYATIVKDEFKDCPLWYRCVYSKISDDIDWTFWQYSNRGRLKGYKGEETYIDLNVFYGDDKELETYFAKKEK